MLSSLYEPRTDAPRFARPYPSYEPILRPTYSLEPANEGAEPFAWGRFESMAASRAAPKFITASSIPHFSLGIQRLDSLLGPFKPERLTVLSGSLSSAVAELVTFRAQFPIEAGGLDSGVLFVDGGNRSDPYLLSVFAKQARHRPASMMRRVATCRVFTFYQLADFISSRLAEAVEDYGVRLVVVSDVLGTFNEPELDEREARRMLSAAGEGIRRVQKKALVIATLVSPNKYDDMIASWADTMAVFSQSRGTVKAELLKHKNRPPEVANFRLSQLLRVIR